MPGTPAWTQQLSLNAKDVDRINQVAISDDGSVAAGATYFFVPKKHTSNTTRAIGVFAYDNNGNELLAHRFSATAAPNTEGGPYSLAVSPDGKYVATGGLIGVNSSFFYVYDLSTKAQYDAFAGSAATSTRVNFVSISGKTAAGNYVAAAGADKLYVWVGKADNWKIASVQTTGQVEEVAVSKDGKWIVAAIEGGSVVLISNADGTGQHLVASNPYTFVVGGATMRAMSVAITSDSSGFAVAVTNLTLASGSAVYFQTAGFTPNVALNPFSTNQLAGCTSCRWIDVSKDGKYIAAVGNVGTDQTTDKGLLFLFQNTGGAYSQAFLSTPHEILQSPNSVSIDDTGLNIVVADGYLLHQNKAAFYYFSPTIPGDPAKEALTWSYIDYIMNRSAAISADGSAMIGGGNDGNMYYFNLP